MTHTLLLWLHIKDRAKICFPLLREPYSSHTNQMWGSVEPVVREFTNHNSIILNNRAPCLRVSHMQLNISPFPDVARYVKVWDRERWVGAPKGYREHMAVSGFSFMSGPLLYSLVSFPDPFRKNREGVWQHVLQRRVRAHCTVRANQVAEFSYVMLIKNVWLWRLLTVLVLLILTMLPVGEWGTKGCFRSRERQ